MTQSIPTTAARWLIRAAFRDRTLCIPGEAGWLTFRPAESPSLFAGPQRFEREIRRAWRRLVVPPERVFDVGANIGLTVQRFHALLAGQCHVWAFEPLPRHVALLAGNVRQCHAEIVSAAVSNVDGETHFEENVEHGGLSRLTAVQDQSPDGRAWRTRRRLTVPTIRLDSYCAQHPDARPTFLKIDVEGAGHWVLDGARSLLQTYQPVISCSFHTTDEREGVTRIARECGYRALRIGADGTLAWCERDMGGHFLHPHSARATHLAIREGVV